MYWPEIGTRSQSHRSEPAFGTIAVGRNEAKCCGSDWSFDLGVFLFSEEERSCFAESRSPGILGSPPAVSAPLLDGQQASQLFQLWQPRSWLATFPHPNPNVPPSACCQCLDLVLSWQAQFWLVHGCCATGEVPAWLEEPSHSGLLWWIYSSHSVRRAGSNLQSKGEQWESPPD